MINLWHFIGATVLIYVTVGILVFVHHGVGAEPFHTLQIVLITVLPPILGAMYAFLYKLATSLTSSLFLGMTPRAAFNTRPGTLTVDHGPNLGHQPVGVTIGRSARSRNYCGQEQD